MNNEFLGIDLGTSSVKLLCSDLYGNTKKSSAAYKEASVSVWCNALISALKKLDLSNVCAVGLSSQVGTYIVNEQHIINWYDSAGKCELEALTYSNERFINEINMPHPNINSYPIPRLLYIKKHFSNIFSVYQPKDLIGRLITGVLKTDPYSWRGLANTDLNEYSKFFLNELEINCLPEIIGYNSILGCVTKEFSNISGLKSGIPVVIGLNDFFSSLLGMGITSGDEIFDISGTSEHIGCIENTLNLNTDMVSCPFIKRFIHYGVTASSGASLDFGIKSFNADKAIISEKLIKNAPLFAPYLNGERAPIFDSDARGLFFGIGKDCSLTELAYSVLEGVAFSLYHIYEKLGAPSAKKLLISGGAAKNKTLNKLKAQIFNIPSVTLKENDTSALGAVICAASGTGYTSDISAGAKLLCKPAQAFKADCEYRELLQKRYKIYKELYPSLQSQFKELKEVRL